jgi:antibiotic biosynthesis monooxygenase (ABM) superfamily enzyme
MADGMSSPMESEDGEVTIVTQTTVRPDSTAAFETWQQETRRIIGGFTGFLAQTEVPPSPPAQEDWVIMQRFGSGASAIHWLNSPERLERLTIVQPLLTGRADVHVVRAAANATSGNPISAVVSTRVKPGCELAYRRWEQKVAVAQSAAKGLQGYRFEPPIPGVQDDWLAILRFDTEENLRAWLDSPARKALVAEAEAFTEEFHYRVARTGFDQWFQVPREGGKGPAVWKQNLSVLLMLYPVVFLFGHFIQVPLLQVGLGIPFAVALLVGNVASVILLNWLVPWTNRRFKWWLDNTPQQSRTKDVQGGLIIVALLVVLAIIFWRAF